MINKKTNKNAFGEVLKKWRKLRRYSQLQLAIEIDVSSKHISFLETGRSTPSREMILRIGSFLYLPKREINQGLLAARFAPEYSELSSGHEDLKPIFTAIQTMIENHMPYPALVLNQNWDVVNMNESAKTLLDEVGYSGSNNLIEAIISDDPETSKIINWHESASAILMRLRYEINLLGANEYLENLAQQLSKRLAPDNEWLGVDGEQVAISTRLQIKGKKLSFFSMITQLGTVQDAIVSELKVELMFPLDEQTRDFYR
ncbi:MAG: helix-turn-helix domain-containing protein [Cocleimonas sp.]